MKRSVAVFFVVLALFSVSAFASPDTSYIITYYDSSGNEIGYYAVNCNQPFVQSSGSTSSIFMKSPEDSCGTVQPMSCTDQGLTSISSCPGWCVSASYKTSYEANRVPDCDNRCADGINYGSCPGW
jgi:hypothetical protein